MMTEFETINSVPHQERFSMVSKIQRVIPRENIRIQMLQDKPIEMWGVVCLPLPHIFRVWRSHKDLAFLRNGMNLTTEWGFVHVPQNPADFYAPIFTEPIGEDDMKYILRRLRVEKHRIDLSAEDGEIPMLYKLSLKRRMKSYKAFNRRYFSDRILKMAYSTAVSIVCDEIETKLYPSS